MHIERTQLKASGARAPIDYPTMVASVLTVQAASPAAAAQIHHDVARRIDNSAEDAMATLMQARPGWRAAAGVLRGSFHPAVALLINTNSF